MWTARYFICELPVTVHLHTLSIPTFIIHYVWSAGQAPRSGEQRERDRQTDTGRALGTGGRVGVTVGEIPNIINIMQMIMGNN